MRKKKESSMGRKVVLFLMLLVSLGILFVVRAARNEVTAQSEIRDAGKEIATSERDGAGTWSKALLDEARFRLEDAKDELASGKEGVEEAALTRALQARWAATAADAKAHWLAAVDEARRLRGDIVSYGGSLPNIDFHEETSNVIERGKTSVERIAFAEKQLQEAIRVGATKHFGADLDKAKSFIESAKKAASADAGSDSADHLAYVAEMMARRARYLTSAETIDDSIPELRLRRAELARAAMAAKASNEAQARSEVEKQLADLQAKLASDETERKAARERLEDLRRDVDGQYATVLERLDSERKARADAESKLDDLRNRYEIALVGAGAPAETEDLRRGVQDQEALVASLVAREAASAKAVKDAGAGLREQLAKDRASRIFTNAELDTRAKVLDTREQNLDVLDAQMSQHAADRKRLDEAYSKRIVALEKRSRESDAQMVAMKKSLARVADTRSDARGFIVSLPDLLFETGKAELEPGARASLARIAGYLRTDPNVRITVEGHTDSVGDAAMNERLSRERAKAVADFLAGEGISASRITSVGRGESEPVASNASAVGRQQNRRVELVIVDERSSA